MTKIYQNDETIIEMGERKSYISQNICNTLRSRTAKNSDYENTGLTKAQKRVNKGFIEIFKMSGLTKVLTKLDKKGLARSISKILTMVTDA